MNTVVVLGVLAALFSYSLADNSGCPHPNEARNKILEQLLVAPASNDGRHIIDVQIPSQVLGREDLSCIHVVANRNGATPDYLSFGRNRYQGYSVIIHSRIRNPLNATLYIYTT